MTAARHLIANPDILRTAPSASPSPPGMEIGRGVDPRLAKDLKADFSAYTLDGGAAGEIYESFSADGAVVKIEGVSVHPGTAKDKLVNALHLGAKIISTLPQARMTPETTSTARASWMAYAHGGRRERPHPALTSNATGWRPRVGGGARPARRAARPNPRARLPGEIRRIPGRCATGWKKDMAPVDLLKAPAAIWDRAGVGPDPRWHRWLSPDGNGRALSERLHRDAGTARTARMDFGAGHGPVHPPCSRLVERATQ